MKEEQLMNELKANFFELTYNIDSYDRKETMDTLCARMKKILRASNIIFYIYNKWKFDQPFSYYTCTYPITYFNDISIDQFKAYFNQMPYVSKLDDTNLFIRRETLSNQLHFILKLHCTEKYYGFVLISFTNKQSVSEKVLNQVRKITEHVLRMLHQHRQNKIFHERNQQLFQLSTRLQSVLQTEDVLEKVYRTMRLIYPTYNYSFLMSQDFHSEGIPIKQIEYSKDIKSSPEIIAFINNSLQITHIEDQTYIFSPLSGKQGVYGVLEIIIPQVITPMNEDIHFIEKFTKMVGRAIERTTLYQTSNKLVSDLQTINNASRDLNVNLDRDEITNTVKKYIVNTCKAEQIGVIFFPRELDIDGKIFEVQQGSAKYFSTEEGEQLITYIYEKVLKDPKPYFSGSLKAEKVNTHFNSIMIIPLQDSE